MRRIGIFLFVIMTLPSCEEEVPEVSFRIETEGFVLQEAIRDPVYPAPTFIHKVSGGSVTFSDHRHTYEFNTKKLGLEEYLFQLPEGEYRVEFDIPMASLYGQKGGSFKADPFDVVITRQTEMITAHVEANCAMFMVYDELDQLDDGIYMIERHSYAHGYFKSYPLYVDSLSGTYYAYFTPDTVPEDPSAFLWFYEGRQGKEEGGLSTTGFEIGYKYNIRVLE